MNFKVHLSRPDITESEIEAVCQVLRSPNLSLGPKLREFEQGFERYLGRKHAIAVNSGTSGLFLCTQALGWGPGDEILTTPFTFIATINIIIMCGATPVFVDIDPVTLNMAPAKIEAKITRKTKGIVPVEVFGSPAGFDRITAIAKKHNLTVLEDSCEALGSSLNGVKAGNFGKMSTFAFYPNKQMTTGEGGIILTDDDELAETCRCLRNQGRGSKSSWLAHERVGYNYRLSDINCALGIAQLARLEEFVEKRACVASMYGQLLAGEKRVSSPQTPEGCRMSWFVYVIRLADKYTQEQRDTLIQKMHARGIQVSNYFPPMYLQPFIAKKYGFKKGDFPVTDAVAKSTMALPFHNNLSAEEAKLVVAELTACLNEL
ncbi:MAG: DegT/DnrJ/EryC1/StrS family aminotransferase [Planctomycetaceae bacterium]|nr:DegT/DnrJ/EryC1/StrS family aminotransferase [Planctomycetaceae bacterium]